jgi:hypothetical protein
MAKAIEKLKAIAKARSSAQALKKWAESGGDVPLNYKGREHVWAKKVKKFAEGGEAQMQAGGIAKLAKTLKGAKEVPEVNRLDMNFKDVTKRVPELTEAAQKVAAGQMTAKEYADLVNRVKPVKPYEFVPMPASDEDAARALTSNKKAMFGKTREIPAGEATDLRLDIPAYKDHGVWVNSVHRKGQPTAYGPVSSVRNAAMSGAPDKAMRVATGEAAKGPWAVISGEWNPMDEAAAVKNAQKYLKHKDWRQVGYDPERHGYFYDRATMDPVIGADEVLQIGPLVLAKKPKYGNPDDFPFKEGGKVEDKAYVGYRRAGRRPESQQNREASANIPVAVARGLVSGTLGMPGDLESLARLPYELITGNESPTILPTSGDIEKRLPLRGASQTPVGELFTGAGQLAGGAYTGPLSGARAATAVPKSVMRAGKDFVQAAGQPAVNVIKPKGGNFLTGSVEKALAPLKTRTIAGETPAQRIPKHEALLSDPSLNKDQIDRVLYQLEETKKEAAIDQWIDRNLGNYVKKEMATPEDPVRRLADQGITHLPADAMNRGQWLSENMEAIRRSEGFPGAGMARTEAGRGWENLADESIQITAPIVANKEMLAANPWLSKLEPNQSVYRARQADVSELGFDHIMDVLRQDVASGRIRPEQLSKVSMEQAVRRTHDFDQEMAKKMREAQIKATEGMPVHKEYPEGYRWIELAAPKAKVPEGAIWEEYNGMQRLFGPKGESLSIGATKDEAIGLLNRKEREKALEDALKYEGDTMGHCVGGYCPDVMEGRSRIYSLRDAKGEPHVTVEVNPSKTLTPEKRAAQMESIVNRMRGEGMSEEAAMKQAEKLYPESETLSRITQIKGKQNRAPNEEYLPFVQDFVRGGQWSDVGDFKNTGLIRKSDLIDRFGPDELDAIGKGEYLTKGEYDDLLLKALKPEGMKAGGEVKMAGGGAMKEALKKLLKKEKVDHPLVFPRAEPKGKEDIRPIAQRMAEQMTGDFVRQNHKLTTNPAGKSRKQFEREKSIPLVTRNVVPEKDVPPIDYEKFKDYAMVGVPGDPSLGGVAKRGSLTENTKPTVELTQVGDITPDQPVPLFGGPRFGNDETFWASNADAATPVQNNVNALSELYDAPVLGKYIKMASDSANFALHNLDSLLAIQRPERLDPRKMEQLNELIRKGSPKYGDFPGFKGFEDPIDVLLQSQLNSKLRKHIAETLTKPTITDTLGLPNGLDVVAAITHPQLRNLETGVSGFSVGQMTPGAVLRRGESAHPTYDTDITGKLIFQNKYPTPYEIAFPDTTAYARSQLTPGVQEFNMMKLLGPRERIDQQYIDEMKMYEELMKQYTGKKKGGAVGGLSAVEKV